MEKLEELKEELDIEELKKLAAQKKKFKAGLLNPNARRKKAKGAIFKAE